MMVIGLPEEHLSGPHAPVMLERFGSLPRRTSIVESIVQQLLNLVQQGVLRPGDRLPTEHELAEVWGVGRSSVREALRVFQLLGAIESRPGKGAVLANLAPLFLITDWSQFTGVASVSDILEARAVLEPAIVRLAAVRADEEDIARLRETIERGWAARDDAEAGLQARLDFHIVLMEVADNATLLLISRLLRALYYESTRLTERDPDTAPLLLRDHEEILEAIKAHDPDRAAEAMARHLRHGTRLVLGLREWAEPPLAEDEEAAARRPGEQPR